MAWPQALLLIDSGKPPSRPLVVLGNVNTTSLSGAGVGSFSVNIKALEQRSQLVVVVAMNTVNAVSPSPSFVGGGLTWTLRLSKIVTRADTSRTCLFAFTAFPPAAFAQTTGTFTVGSTALAGAWNCYNFQVQGGASDDPNAGVPVSINNNASVTYSTTNANDLAYTILNSGQPADTVPTGFTLLVKDNNGTPALTIGYRVLAAAQTNVVATWTLANGPLLGELIGLDAIKQE